MRCMSALLAQVIAEAAVDATGGLLSSLAVRGQGLVVDRLPLGRSDVLVVAEESIATDQALLAELRRVDLHEAEVAKLLTSPEIAGVVKQLAALVIDRADRASDPLEAPRGGEEVAAGVDSGPDEDHGEEGEAVGVDPPELDEKSSSLRKRRAQRQRRRRNVVATDQRNEQDAREEIRLLLALHLDRSQDDMEVLATHLQRVLTSVIRKLLSDSGVLASARKLRLGRSSLVGAEIAALGKNVELLRRAQFEAIAPLLLFERKYRGQVANAEGDIRLPDLDRARRVPLDAIYVPPQLSPSRSHRRLLRGKESWLDDEALVSTATFDCVEPFSRNIQSDDLVRRFHRVVILGDPGGGKSTLIQALAYRGAIGDSLVRSSDRSPTPIVIRVRDYLTARPCALVDFIEKQCRSRYQIPVPDGAIEYLLLNSRACVLFDGLDEVLEVHDRVDVVGELEAFANAYPSIPIIVTSRVVGYDEAPLDPRQFEVLRLGEFDEGAVAEYARLWFGLMDEENTGASAEVFLDESQEAPDIRSNPMMLGLMCNLFHGEGSIPNNRPDLYAKCASLLFDRWDARRGIRARPSFEHHLRGAIENLAFTMVERSRGAVMAESAVVSVTADYLLGRLFERPAEAEAAAQSFVDFCKGRAWVLTDAGILHGERLFGFTHQTFLEFFAACFLARRYESPAELVRTLTPRIERQEWDLVSQMAVQVRAELSTGSDDILIALLRRAGEVRADRRRRSTVVDFAVRSLAFLVPTPAVTRGVVKEALGFCLSPVSPDPPRAITGVARDTVLSDLLYANAEVRRTVAREIGDSLGAYRRDGTAERADSATRVPSVLRAVVDSWRDGPRRQFWSTAVGEIQAALAG
jgi:hypothetical protein